MKLLNSVLLFVALAEAKNVKTGTRWGEKKERIAVKKTAAEEQAEARAAAAAAAEQARAEAEAKRAAAKEAAAQAKKQKATDAKVAHYQEKKALKAEAKQVAQAQAQIMNNNGAGLIGMRSLNVGGNGGSKEPRKEKWTPCGDN